MPNSSHHIPTPYAPEYAPTPAHKRHIWARWPERFTSRVTLPLGRSSGSVAGPTTIAVRGFGASQGSCDPVKVTRPALRIESSILCT